MPSITVSRTIHATLPEVWASWDAFGDIDKFNPGVRKSHLLPGSEASGLGARRQCDMKDGRNHVREEIVEYDPQRSMTIKIVEGTLPMKSAVAVVSFERAGERATRVTFEMSFEPRMGLLGALMSPMMKIMMRRTIDGILDGNATYVEGTMIRAAA